MVEPLNRIVMEITQETKLTDLLDRHPWLMDEMVKVNAKFKMLGTPVGKIMMGKASIAEMSKRSGMEVGTLISRISELIINHTTQKERNQS